MKIGLLILGLLLHFSTKSQELDKGFLLNKDWCADNFERHFYKADTINLFAITDSLTPFQQWNIEHRKLQYNNKKDIAEIKFKKKGHAEIKDLSVEGWMFTYLVGKWTWTYDKDSKKLNFFLIKNSGFLSNSLIIFRISLFGITVIFGETRR